MTFEKGKKVKRKSTDYLNVEKGKVYIIKKVKTVIGLPFLELEEVKGKYLAYNFEKVPTNTVKRL